MKKEVTLTVFFNIITVVFAFCFLSYLTKHLTIEDFGKYQLIVTYIVLLGVFTFSGFNMLINRSVLRGRDYHVRVLFLNSYKSSVVLFLILIFVVGVFQLFIQNEKLELLYIALIFIPLLSLEKYEAVLNAKQKFAKIRLLSLMSLTCHIGISLIFMQFTDQYLYIFLSLFITKLFAVCAGLLYAKKLLLKEEVNYNPKDDLKEGYRLSLLSFYNVGIGHLDKLIVGLIDYKLLAIYAIGILIPMKVKDQLKLVVNIMIQSWAKNGNEAYKAQLKKFHNLTFLLTLILAVFLAYSSSFYIPIIFSDEYLNSQNIIWIISFSIPFTLSAFVHETFIVVFYNTVFYQRVTYSKQVVYLVSLAILAPNFGTMGIAVSILVISIYDFSINYIYYNKYKNKTVSV